MVLKYYRKYQASNEPMNETTTSKIFIFPLVVIKTFHTATITHLKKNSVDIFPIGIRRSNIKTQRQIFFRLDLDACKTKVRKARSMLGQQTKDGILPEVALEQAERDLRVAQSEFDRQAEITKLLLEGISTSQTSHLRYLHEFVGSQVRYYAKCASAMNDLQHELANCLGAYIPIEMHDETTKKENDIPMHRRARVLCSYDAKDSTELSLTANEVITGSPRSACKKIPQIPFAPVTLHYGVIAHITSQASSKISVLG
ncbi:endophilin-B2-like [Contarinia nasturtii]|uniref:endophilin-B2-like n=1 Tax=Contarinia nasturtii TaxID=265458 RepID=UPI0012D3F6DC|nr:endophilin-B2-like [Contarinia nasturtii]